MLIYSLPASAAFYVQTPLRKLPLLLRPRSQRCRGTGSDPQHQQNLRPGDAAASPVSPTPWQNTAQALPVAVSVTPVPSPEPRFVRLALERDFSTRSIDKSNLGAVVTAHLGWSEQGINPASPSSVGSALLSARGFVQRSALISAPEPGSFSLVIYGTTPALPFGVLHFECNFWFSIYFTLRSAKAR